jgi:2,3-dihydroxyphenylpropionate 1,2-dioxygenase
VNSTVIGGAMLPHAPQFFTMPETEDREMVGRVRTTAAEIGARLKAMAPDLWIIISNDHSEQFFHLAAPAFTIHVGSEARGAFAGRDFYWKVPSEVGFELVRQMYRQGFDPAFTSTAKIDYAIGNTLDASRGRGSGSADLRQRLSAAAANNGTLLFLWSGDCTDHYRNGTEDGNRGEWWVSHFPGTERYSRPELAWDNALLENLATGNLKSLIGWDEATLDQTGNVELRCWAVAAGALGERKPDIVRMEPSWHHNYASLGWFGAEPSQPDPHYPSIKPALVELTTALHGLAHDEEMRRQYLADSVAYADRFRLTPPQRAALLALDRSAIAAMGVHPLVPFLATMQIERQRRG